MGALFTRAGVVDLHGRPVRDLQIKGSNLLKAQQWAEYLEHWAEMLAHEPRWVLFLLHATVNFHQAFGVLARRLRKNRWWAGGETMAEATTSLTEDAAQRLAWFENTSEQLDQTQVPEWAKFMFIALEGGYRMLVRVAKETDQVLRKGHLLIPVDRLGQVTPDDGDPGAVATERE